MKQLFKQTRRINTRIVYISKVRAKFFFWILSLPIQFSALDLVTVCLFVYFFQKLEIPPWLSNVPFV